MQCRRAKEGSAAAAAAAVRGAALRGRRPLEDKQTCAAYKKSTARCCALFVVMWCAAPARADYRPQLLRATSDRARRSDDISSSVGVNIVPLGDIVCQHLFSRCAQPGKSKKPAAGSDAAPALRSERRPEQSMLRTAAPPSEAWTPSARLPPRLAAAAPALPPGVRSAAPRHRLGARSGGLSSRGACRRFVKTGCTCPAPLPSSSLQAPHRLPWHSLARSPARAGLRPRQLAAAVKPPLTKSSFCPIGCANCRQNKTFCIIGTVDSSVSPCGNEARICIERRI